MSPAFAVIDDLGYAVNLPRPAQRIISLAPDLTEIIFAIGAGNKIVGVVSGSDYPSAAKNIAVVAGYNSVDAEAILLLHPDLIVAWADTNYVAQLKKLGIPVYLSQQRKLLDIAATMRKLGVLVGVQASANQTANNYLQRYTALQKKYAHLAPVTVFYQVWPQPLMTITKNSWINDVITLCGGRNIFADLHGVAPEVSIEAVIAANPDIIIGTTDAKQDWRRQWLAWPQLTAVKKLAVYSLNPDLINRAGPRVLAGAEEMCLALRGF
jgi:iron complex transport system substrate-binding protein